MIAVSQPSPEPKSANRAIISRTRLLPFSGGALVAGLFGFFAFLPYPAIPAGENSAIQMGTIIALPLALMTLTLCWKKQPYFLLPLILLPVCLSVLKVAFTGEGDLDLCLKALVQTVASGTALLATQFIAPRHSLSLLIGIAWAAILHTIVGIWQLYGFSTGEFPLLFLYVNPSFLSVQENVATIVQYIQRPFGLFPEPSAMTSSLAPWTLFWIAEIFGLVQLRERPKRWHRALFAVAAAGSLFLIILSRSGHASVTMAAVMLFTILWVARSRATVGSFLSIVSVFGIALPVLLVLLFQSLSTRIDGPAAILDRSRRFPLGWV
jgi:hypothetical protein